MAINSNKIPIPVWAKATLVIGAGLTGIAIFYVVKRNINNIKLNLDAKKEVNATTETLANLTKAGQKPTLDALKLSTMANQLFSYANGYGTDVQGIYKVFSAVNNDVDVVNLIKAYGVKEISTGAFNPAPNLKGTLSQMLADELSPPEIKALNDLLSRKGIKYRF